MSNVELEAWLDAQALALVAQIEAAVLERLQNTPPAELSD